MTLFGETRQGFVITGFRVVIVWRLMVIDATSYLTIIWPPPPHLAALARIVLYILPGKTGEELCSCGAMKCMCCERLC